MSATILLVEDDSWVRGIVRRRLEAAGYDVIEAADGASALERYRDSTPHLVITDVIMPEMDGHALIAELLADYPRARIVAMSGALDHDVPSLLADARQSGAVQALPKPFTTRQLMDAVETTLTLEDAA